MTIRELLNTIETTQSITVYRGKVSAETWLRTIEGTQKLDCSGKYWDEEVKEVIGYDHGLKAVI